MNQEQFQNFDIAVVNAASKADAIAAIDRHFIILNDGNIAHYHNGKYEIRDSTVINKLYIKRLSEPLQKYFNKEKTDIREIVYELNKPVLYDNCLNLCPSLLHTQQPYDTFPESTKQAVELMLNHIKEVFANNKEDAYRFILKWLANMIKGKKNNSVLYLKGPQGAGKSTPVDFIKTHVIGLPLSLETGSGPLRNRFNSELEGKLFVIFEELENFGPAEWTSISSTLKRWITASTYTIEGKGDKVRQVANINNYMLISNNDAIKDDDGRRYFFLDISTKYIGNKQYFDTIYKRCFNNVVGHAFYCFLLEIDTTDFNPQDFPTTQNKGDSYAKRLLNEYVFLKENYIRHKQGIDKVPTKDLYSNYKIKCREGKAKGPQEFYRILRDVGIEPKKTNGSLVFNVTYDTLCQIAKKFHWIHEYDEIDMDDNEGEERLEEDDIEPVIKELTEKNTILVQQNNALLDEIEMLRAQLTQQASTKKPAKKVIVEPEPEPEPESEEEEVIVKKPVKKIKKVVKKTENTELVEVFDKKEFTSFLKKL